MRDDGTRQALDTHLSRRSAASVIGAMNPWQCVGGEICWKICMAEGPCRGRKTFAMPPEALHQALDHVAAHMGDHVGTATWRLEDVIDDDGLMNPKRRERLGHGSEGLIKPQQHIIGRTPLPCWILDMRGTIARLRASARMCSKKRRRLNGEYRRSHMPRTARSPACLRYQARGAGRSVFILKPGETRSDTRSPKRRKLPDRLDLHGTKRFHCRSRDSERLDRQFGEVALLGALRHRDECSMERRLRLSARRRARASTKARECDCSADSRSRRQAHTKAVPTKAGMDAAQVASHPSCC